MPVGLTTFWPEFVGTPGCGAAGGSGGFGAGFAAACRRFGFCAVGGCGVSTRLGGETWTGGKRSGDADCCADAVETAKGESGISTVDASQKARRRLEWVIERIVGPRYDVSGTSQRTKSHHAVPPAQ